MVCFRCYKNVSKMIRSLNNKNNLANLILCSDWHLREDTPVCYTGDYQKEQWNSVDFISELQKKHDCPVIHAGDLFDYWKPSPALLSETIKHLPKQFYTVYGQHDLPQHNLELAYKSGIYTLQTGGHLSVMPTCSWGQTPNEFSSTMYNLLVWHIFNYQGKEPWPGCTDPTGLSLLKKYPQYDLILTGDNHKPFVEEYKGRLLVNPGSLMRMDADQIDHNPRVYLWYAETNTVKPIYIPIVPDVISRKHIEIKNQRDERIDSFVSHLNTDWKASVSFENNLQRFEKENIVRKDVMNIIYKSLE